MLYDYFNKNRNVSDWRRKAKCEAFSCMPSDEMPGSGGEWAQPERSDEAKELLHMFSRSKGRRILFHIAGSC